MGRIRFKMDKSYPAAEVVLSSYASLLSFAETNGGIHPLLSSKGPTLTRFISSKSKGDNDGNSTPVKCYFPSLSLTRHKSDQRKMNVNRHDMAALNLATPTSVDRDNMEEIPRLILKSIYESFDLLIVSRLRCSLLILLQKTMKNGQGSEVDILMQLLSTQAPIALTTIVTSFHVFPTNDSQGHKRLSSLVLPLSFEAVIDFKAVGKMITVPLKAPGTISGRFDSTDGLLTQVEIALDTIELLDCMMKQARLVVRKTLQVAANLTTVITHKKQLPKPANQTDDTDTNPIKQLVNSSLKLNKVRSSPPKEKTIQSKDKNETDKDTTEEVRSSSQSDEDESKKPLFHEFFSWLKDEDMILKEEPTAFDSNSSGDENDQPMPTPLSSLGWQAFTDLAAAQAVANENQEQTGTLSHNDTSN